MSNIKPLSQLDPRWADKKLGTGTIKDRGCVVVSCAMLGQMTPDRIVDNADFTPQGAIYWQSLSRLGFTFHWRGYTYENDRVLGAIKDYGDCLVEVLHPSGFKHWVLFIGNKKMLDPLSGKEESTSKYPNLTGYCILQPPAQKPENSELEWLRKQVEQLRNSLEEQKVKYAPLESTIAEKNEAIRQLTANEKKWQAEAKSANENLGKVLEEKGELEKTIASLERKVDKLTEELAEMEKKKNALWQDYKRANDERTDKLSTTELSRLLLARLFNIMKRPTNQSD